MADWRFINIDGTTAREDLDGPLPNTGDGKFYNQRGYQVVAVVKNAMSWPDGLVVAYEHAPSGSVGNTDAT